MIGQKELLSQIDSFNVIPRFIILSGQKGGRRLVAKHIGDLLDAHYAEFGNKADEIRELKTVAYKSTVKTLFVLSDIQNMNIVAENALLKILEEPPNSAYIIATSSDLSHVADTIISRAVVLRMNEYSKDEIMEYYKTLGVDKCKSWVLECCETPSDVSKICSMSSDEEFYNYVSLAFDNIDKVSGANSFKMSQKLAIKNTDTTGYDLGLFWKMFMILCEKSIKDDPDKYSAGILITSKYLMELNNASLNRQYIFDMWLLKIRERWM